MTRAYAYSRCKIRDFLSSSFRGDLTLVSSDDQSEPSKVEPVYALLNAGIHNYLKSHAVVRFISSPLLVARALCVSITSNDRS